MGFRIEFISVQWPGIMGIVYFSVFFTLFRYVCLLYVQLLLNIPFVAVFHTCNTLTGCKIIFQKYAYVFDMVTFFSELTQILLKAGADCYERTPRPLTFLQRLVVKECKGAGGHGCFSPCFYPRPNLNKPVRRSLQMKYTSSSCC